jgi:hypothetical protein
MPLSSSPLMSHTLIFLKPRQEDKKKNNYISRNKIAHGDGEKAKNYIP